MSSNSVSMILFMGPAIVLNDAVQALTESGLSVSADGNELTVHWNAGPVLAVGLSRADWVLEEVAEIGEGTEFASELSRCESRFEIAIPDLEEVLDEINTLIQVQCALQDLTQGFLFNSWNCELLPPD